MAYKMNKDSKKGRGIKMGASAGIRSNPKAVNSSQKKMSKPSLKHFGTAGNMGPARDKTASPKQEIYGKGKGQKKHGKTHG